MIKERLSDVLNGMAVLIALLTLTSHAALAQQIEYPQEIYGGAWKAGHVQGIAVDRTEKVVYWSFTTVLVKTDFQGKVLGTVTGFLGHLGCLCFNDEDGKVYGSLEYKDDSIGKGILKMEGSDKKFEIGFFIAIFDGSKIDRIGINASDSDVLKTVLINEAVKDYKWSSNELVHMHACSGIDGVSIGPRFGKSGGEPCLTVAYGVYGDTSRTDNDYQVLLQYSLKSLEKTASPFYQDNLEHKGPRKPLGKYFVYTGNTNWGVQNLCYDKDSGNWLMFVYKGSKKQFPNGDLYIADGAARPRKEVIKGCPVKVKGLVVPLLDKGLLDTDSNVRYWKQGLGYCGSASLGNGLFYLVSSSKEDGLQKAVAKLFRWTGTEPAPLELVK